MSSRIVDRGASAPARANGAPSLSETDAARLAVDEGLAADGPLKKRLKRWAAGRLERVVAQVGDAYQLAPAERDRLRAVLTETKDAKLREYWQCRAPFEATAFAARSVAVTAVMLAVGFAAPGALVPSLVGVGVGLAGQAVTTHEMLGHALEGRAALEVSRLQRERGDAPAKKGWLDHLTSRIAGHVERRAAERFALDPEEREAVTSAVEDARVQKQREVLELRTPVEVTTMAATAATAIGACLGLGLIGPAAAVVMGASAVLGGVAAAGLSLWKMHAALAGAASAKLEDLAARAEEGSPRRQRFEQAHRVVSRAALAAADRVGAEFEERFHLDPAEQKELEAILRRTAAQKSKELLGERLAPTLAAPLGRGAAIATLAATAVSSPTLAASAVLGSVAESAVSTALLFQQIDAALQGAAYAYVKTLRRRELAQGS